MKPLKSESQDTQTLEKLGRASVQIVHDLKNQLNGLKLYATFLRKRMEKAQAPTDEQETINKLIAGLERAATDMSLLVSYGRPLELQQRPGADLSKILAGALAETNGVRLETEDVAPVGDFDAIVLSEAFKMITAAALNLSRAGGEKEPLSITLRRETVEGRESALIEWRGVKPNAGSDLFHSFAGGDGLRLALAAKIVEAHGGEAAQHDDALRIRLAINGRA